MGKEDRVGSIAEKQHSRNWVTGRATYRVRVPNRRGRMTEEVEVRAKNERSAAKKASGFKGWRARN